MSPNARVHWAVKARAISEYRVLAWARAREELGLERLEWERAEARVVAYLPDARRPDPDNFKASLKPVWDGLVDARVLTDDDQLIVHHPTFEIDRQHPRIVLEIEPIAS